MIPLRSGKEINLRICREDRDMILGTTARSIPQVCNELSARKAFTKARPR